MKGSVLKTLEKKWREAYTMPNQPWSLHRRDLFRLAGAGTAAVLSAGVAGAAPGVSPDPDTTAAWEKVNDTDPGRSRLWEQRKDVV